MSPTVLNEKAVEALLPQVDMQKMLRRLFAALAENNAVQPAQTVTLFPNDEGDFITYQGVLAKDKVFGAKLSPYIANDGKAVVTAWTCLMSMETGLPILLCDSGKLTRERTAGTSALAVDLLSKPECQTLAIIGSGSIAMAHWMHVQALRPWEDVRVWSPSLANDAAKREAWSKECSNVTFADSAEAAASGADVVMLCTSSGTPVLDTDVIDNGTLVTSISTNVQHAHEIPPQFLNKAQVYCDYKVTTPDSAGEMVIACRDHNWTADAVVGDLPTLVSGQCPAADENSPVFFRSLGLGLEDIAIAYEIYVAHSKQQG